MSDSSRSGVQTRRQLLERAAALGVASSTAAQLLLGADPASAAKRKAHRHSAHHHHHRHLRRAKQGPVPLPSPQQVREDFTKMVEFGPRLTGAPEHTAYIEWLEEQFTDAGLKLLPPDKYTTDRWLAQDVGLDILEGTSAGPVKVGAYYPRSQQTPAAGITGPLVYGGAAPAPDITFSGLADAEAALAAWPAQLASWANGLSGVMGGETGSILLVDVPFPIPFNFGELLADSTYLYWPGHSDADWANADYTRLWLEPGLSGVPLQPFQSLGAAGVVFILNCSYDALKGAYAPFESGYQPLPALYVDRDTGSALRNLAAARPKTRLTLTATREKAPTHAVTAVLPGRSKEAIIFNTHTDGEGFVEENGGVVFTQLARYFASLPEHKRLERTLVFAAWPGHMSSDLPQCAGWISAHPDIMKVAAAALTVEHFGCSEWNDTITRGYKPTGLPEALAVWTTQGEMFNLTRDTVAAHNLTRTALMRPPAQFGVGSAFQGAGVPQIGAIAGPEYLLTISPDGDLDKLDETLASRQIAWIADLATRIDPVPASTLKQGDPTLGVAAP